MVPVIFKNSISALSIVLFPIGCLRAILTRARNGDQCREF